MTNLNVTQKELAQILKDFKVVEGMAVFSAIEQETEPKMLVKSRTTKEPNPFGLVTKRSELNVILNAKYETQVVNQLKREDKDESEYKRGQAAMEIVFGDNNQFFGMNPKNDKLVIRYRPNPNENKKPETKYFVDGIETPKSKLVDYLPAPSKATNQGTEKEILWRTVYFENIKKMTLNQVCYTIID
jgi:uncharacterized protein YpmS